MPQERSYASSQEQHRSDDEAQASVNEVVQQQALDQSDILDAVLDDIEAVLETNAEEYVSSFVQKGGE